MSDIFPIEIWIKIGSQDLKVWFVLMKTIKVFHQYVKKYPRLIQSLFGKVIEFNGEIYWKLGDYCGRNHDLPAYIGRHMTYWFTKPVGVKFGMLGSIKVSEFEEEMSRKISGKPRIMDISGSTNYSYKDQYNFIQYNGCYSDSHHSNYGDGYFRHSNEVYSRVDAITFCSNLSSTQMVLMSNGNMKWLNEKKKERMSFELPCCLYRNGTFHTV